MTNLTLAVLENTELVLVAVFATMMIGIPLAALVLMWFWRRVQGAPPAFRRPADADRGARGSASSRVGGPN
jgi:hypothetical protein